MEIEINRSYITKSDRIVQIEKQFDDGIFFGYFVPDDIYFYCDKSGKAKGRLSSASMFGGGYLPDSQNDIMSKPVDDEFIDIYFKTMDIDYWKKYVDKYYNVFEEQYNTKLNDLIFVSYDISPTLYEILKSKLETSDIFNPLNINDDIKSNIIRCYKDDNKEKYADIKFHINN